MGGFHCFQSSFTDLSKVIASDNAINHCPTILWGAVKRLENTLISARGVDVSWSWFIKGQKLATFYLLLSNWIMHWSVLTYWAFHLYAKGWERCSNEWPVRHSAQKLRSGWYTGEILQSSVSLRLYHWTAELFNAAFTSNHRPTESKQSKPQP